MNQFIQEVVLENFITRKTSSLNKDKGLSLLFEFLIGYYSAVWILYLFPGEGAKFMNNEVNLEETQIHYQWKWYFPNEKNGFGLSQYARRPTNKKDIMKRKESDLHPDSISIALFAIYWIYPDKPWLAKKRSMTEMEIFDELHIYTRWLISLPKYENSKSKSIQ